MAIYTRSEVSATRVVYAIPNPSSYEDLSSAIVAIEKDFRRAHPSEQVWGDTIMVEADEEEIRLWYKKRK